MIKIQMTKREKWVLNFEHLNFEFI